MKYVIWAGVFMIYLLVFAGIFTLLGGITEGLKVETDVEYEVLGQIIVRTEEVEFNDIPAVRWIFGMSGLLITMGIPYAIANILGKTWGSDERNWTKSEKVIWAVVFLVFFTAFSFILEVHTILVLFELPGLIFMAATCAGAYAVSTALCKLTAIGRGSAAAENKGVAI